MTLIFYGLLIIIFLAVFACVSSSFFAFSPSVGESTIKYRQMIIEALFRRANGNRFDELH